MNDKPLKIVYCTPALYMAGGVERVLTLKANYFAEHFGYDITLILTEGKDKPLFYPLSDKIKVINLDINYEVLWTCSFLKKIPIYLRKQRFYKKKLTVELMRIRPDITISLLRREINFLTSIRDGSKKIGELHVNRANYRNFEEGDSNLIKSLFAKFWMRSLVSHLKRLDRFIVLTEEDKQDWMKVTDNVISIPNMLTLSNPPQSNCMNKKAIAVGHLDINKGFDRMILLWKDIVKKTQGWQLHIYGDGDEKNNLLKIIKAYNLRDSVFIHEPSKNIAECYGESSLSLMTSVSEGWGLVITEAMQCGVPVVCYGFKCGPKDIITNGEDGFVIEENNHREFVDKVVYLLNNNEQRVIMGKKASINIQRFSAENIMPKWCSLFKDIVKK